LTEEFPANGVPRKLRAHHQLLNVQSQERDHRSAAEPHRPGKNNVGDFADVPLQKRRRSGFDFQAGLCAPLRFGSVETRPGQGSIGHSALG
jgi:hypothetical protein